MKKVLTILFCVVILIGCGGVKERYEKTSGLKYTKEITKNKEGIIYTRVTYNRGPNKPGIKIAFQGKPTDQQIEETLKATGHYEDGRVYEKQKKYKKAIEEFTRAIEIDPKSFIDVYFHRAEMYFKIWNITKAKDDYSEIIKIDPKNSEAYWQRGILYQMTPPTNFQKSIHDFTKMIEINPSCKNPYQRRSLSYLFQKKHDLALKDINTYIKRAPKDAEGYWDRGFIYECMKEYDKAIFEYSRVIALEDNSQNEKALKRLQEVYFKKAEKLEKEGKLDEAIVNYKECIKKDKETEVAKKAQNKIKKLENEGKP